MRLAKRAQSEEEDDARRRGVRTRAELSQIVRTDAQLAEEAEYEQYFRIEQAAKVKVENFLLEFFYFFEFKIENKKQTNVQEHYSF